jgi:hypothetical protein
MTKGELASWSRCIACGAITSMGMSPQHTDGCPEEPKNAEIARLRKEVLELQSKMMPKNLSVGVQLHEESIISYTFHETLECLMNIAEAETEFLRLDMLRRETDAKTSESDNVKHMHEVARAADQASDRFHGELDSTDFRAVINAITTWVHGMKALETIITSSMEELKAALEDEEAWRQPMPWVRAKMLAKGLST